VTNKDLMRTFADVCDIDVVLPEDPSVPVVLGAAMLGRLAHIVKMATVDGKIIGREEQAEKLWGIMVGIFESRLSGVFLTNLNVGRNDTLWDHRSSRCEREGKEDAMG